MVWAKDPQTGEMALREVTRAYVRHDIPVLELELATGDGVSDVLTTTAEHPFWVKDKGFVPAERLMPGDEVFTSMGGWVRVGSGTWLADTRTVYNLEVDGFHTYFVGQVGAWVHNACTDDWADLAGMLQGAARGKGNFGIGRATREQVDAMGKSWVGDGYKVASDGKTLISKDGLQQYRPPSYKPRLDKVQANLESRPPGLTQWQSNAHVDIID